jgi:hypothetical protein
MRTPEFDLLLRLARTAPDTERANAIINGGIDWETLLDLAAKHRVRPMVYTSLVKIGWGRVPPAIRRDWEDAYSSITGRNRFVAGELFRIADVFRAAELPLVSLKGPALAEMAYGDFALREFADLDFLVRVADFSKAAELLKQLGYKPALEIESGLAIEFLWHQGECLFKGGFEGPEIDLHWRVATRHTALSIEADYFWPRFRPVQIAGETVLSFAPQDLPLYLASQGGQDQWSDLRRLCDLSEFVRRHPDLDWETLIASAQELRGLRMLLLGLQLARELLSAELPPAVEKLIREHTALPRLAAEAVKKLEGQHSPGAVRLFVFQIGAKERWREKVALVAGRLTNRTASDAKWLILPKPLWGLYTVLRPLRMFGKLFSRGDG